MKPYVAMVIAAFVAGAALGAFVQQYRIQNIRLDTADSLVKGYRASEKVNRESIERYAADLERLRHIPARVVRYCPSVPGAASGTGDAAQPGPDQGSGEDVGGLLRGCLRELYRYRALSGALNAAEN